MPVRSSTGKWESAERRKERRSAADRAVYDRMVSHGGMTDGEWKAAKAERPEPIQQEALSR